MTFLNSPFPGVSNATGFDLDMYNRIADGITAMAAAMAGISDQSGNISLAIDKSIEWGSVSKLTWSGSKVQVDYLEILDDPWTFDALAPGGDCTVSNDLTLTPGCTLALSGNLAVAGVIEVNVISGTSFTIEQIAEPDDPPDEHTVMWCSNGTGVGDAGDIMIKIQHGSVVKSTTLVNFV